MDLIKNNDKVKNFLSDELLQDPTNGAQTLNTFNFYCPFCVDVTLWDNKGNHSQCQSCKVYGSNYQANCKNYQPQQHHDHKQFAEDNQNSNIVLPKPCHRQQVYVYDEKCAYCAGAYEITSTQKEPNQCPKCQTETEWNSSIACQLCSQCELVKLNTKVKCANGCCFTDYVEDGTPLCSMCLIQKNSQPQSYEPSPQIAPKEFMYYCIECKKVCLQKKTANQTSTCTECGLQGTNRPRKCKKCTNKTYCFFKVDPEIPKSEQTNKQGIVGERMCNQCYTGFCPKNVSDVMPLECVFCNEVTTWYLYGELNKMKCTNCEGSRQIKCWAAEECQKCEIYSENGLFSFNGLRWCESCIRLQMKSYQVKNQLRESTAGTGVTATQSYIHDCFNCQDKQVWLNLGHYSKCESCHIIGSNEMEQCQICEEWDYLYTITGSQQSKEEAKGMQSLKIGGGEEKVEWACANCFDSIQGQHCH